MHLRWDDDKTTKEMKQKIIDTFIKHCMEIIKGYTVDKSTATGTSVISTTEAGAAATAVQPASTGTDVEKKAVISLLSLFLDRYEGIKELKPE